MSIFDDREFVSIQMGIMSYEDQYFYTLKKDNCSHSTIIKMKTTSMNL